MALEAMVLDGLKYSGVRSHNIRKGIQVQVHYYGVITEDELYGNFAFETRMVDKVSYSKFTYTKCEVEVYQFAGVEGDVVEEQDIVNVALDILQVKVTELTL